MTKAKITPIRREILDEISVRARGPTIFEFVSYRPDCPFCGHFDVKKPWYRTLEVPGWL